MSDDSNAPGGQGKSEKAGVLPEDWQERTAKAITKLVPNAGQCPRCGNRVTIAPNSVSPMVFERPGGITIGGPLYPQAMLVCTTCGHTSYFNLVALGIASGPPEGADNG